MKDTIKNTIIRYGRLISTQEKARELAEKGFPEGTVVIAESQTRGRGRMGREWFSPRGGLWLSLLLRPEMSVLEIPRITMLGALSVAETVKEVSGIEALIKWPNDVVVGRGEDGKFKKVSGILTEAVTKGNLVNYVICGLGVNVNNRVPKQIRDEAVSIKEITKCHVSLEEIIAVFLPCFNSYYLRLKKGKFSEVFQKYKRLSAVLGREVEVEFSGNLLRGKVESIDEYGTLIINTGRGKERVFAGDVRFLRL